MKAIIFLPGTSRFAPAKTGEYIWNEQHQKHIWQGRELDADEFNAVIDRLTMDEAMYVRPSVRLVRETRKKECKNKKAKSKNAGQNSKFADAVKTRPKR
ncbi:MAG: hypothetical protein LBK60_06315 [Verrucomicrobiales bacterium]|jgi:hypothetical protein|nr:hypothetical protein [Verrucomicrobiales bacterium]